MLRAIVAAALYALSVTATVSWIAPGAIWYDTSGDRIDAHGGMILKPGTVYYWVRAASTVYHIPTDICNRWASRGTATPHRVSTRQRTSSTGITAD